MIMFGDKKRFYTRRIQPNDWDLFNHEYITTIKGYDIYKIQNVYFLQVLSKEYFGYKNWNQILKALDVLPEKSKNT